MELYCDDRANTGCKTSRCETQTRSFCFGCCSQDANSSAAPPKSRSGQLCGFRQYSAFLGVSAEKTLEDLPSGVLGGQRDYRYLLESFGPWVGPRTKGREFAPRRTAARSSAARSIVPQALIIFALILGGTAMFAKHLVFGNEANMAEEVVRSESESEPVIVPAIPVPQSNEAAIKPVSTSTQPSAQAAPPDSIDGVPIIARRAIPTGGKGTVVPGLNQVALPPTEILND